MQKPFQLFLFEHLVTLLNTVDTAIRATKIWPNVSNEESGYTGSDLNSMLCSHSFFPSERALWLRHIMTYLFTLLLFFTASTGHTSSALTALCPNTAVLFAFVWVGAVQMVLELFMEAVGVLQRLRLTRCREWKERMERGKCPVGVSVLELIPARRPSDCWRAEISPRPPSLPLFLPLSVQRFPLLWLSAIRSRPVIEWLSFYHAYFRK